MIKGSCLCGAVAYEADGLSGPVVHCHCHTCRKAHSAAFNTSARTRRADFRWVRGEDALASYESTPGKLRHFCGRCGSHLMAEWREASEVVLRVGSIDEGIDIQPVAHIWVNHAAEWDHGHDDLPRYAKGPDSAIVGR